MKFILKDCVCNTGCHSQHRSASKRTTFSQRRDFRSLTLQIVAVRQMNLCYFIHEHAATDHISNQNTIFFRLFMKFKH